MGKYVGTKVIEAEPCKAWKDAGNHKVGEEGYKVIYKDGYVSWSPKDVFEEAYRQIDGMTFGQAIEAMKAGKRCSRHNWNGKGQYIELATKISYINSKGEAVNVNHNTMGNKAIAFIGNSGVQMGWLASQADMLSDDWYIVE